MTTPNPRRVEAARHARRAKDPCVIEHAAQATVASGAVSDVARALGTHHTQASRWARGLQRGPIYYALEEVARKLAADDRTDPFGVRAEINAMIYRRIFGPKSDTWLIVEYYRLRDRVEPRAEMEEDITSRSRNLRAHRDKLIASGNADHRLAAVIDQLIERKIEIDRFSKDGHLIVRSR